MCRRRAARSSRAPAPCRGPTSRWPESAPATCGDAIDVPSRTSYPPPGTDDRIDSPGAKTDRNGATFENHATSSVFVVAPTLTADDTHAGARRLNGEPLLPAAATVATPI